MNKESPQPESINLHQKSRILEINFSNGHNFKLSCELLRVYSPSAEVKGHGPGQSVLQTGKENVSITDIEPVGQYAALMKTEGVNLSFFEDGIKRAAEIAWQVNESTENIGARRLHTVMERLLETLSYQACDLNGDSIVVDADYVNDHLEALVQDEDLSRYIL